MIPICPLKDFTTYMAEKYYRPFRFEIITIKNSLFLLHLTLIQHKQFYPFVSYSVYEIIALTNKS